MTETDRSPHALSRKTLSEVDNAARARMTQNLRTGKKSASESQASSLLSKICPAAAQTTAVHVEQAIKLRLCPSPSASSSNDTSTMRLEGSITPKHAASEVQRALTAFRPAKQLLLEDVVKPGELLFSLETKRAPLSEAQMAVICPRVLSITSFEEKPPLKLPHASMDDTPTSNAITVHSSQFKADFLGERVSRCLIPRLNKHVRPHAFVSAYQQTLLNYGPDFDVVLAQRRPHNGRHFEPSQPAGSKRSFAHIEHDTAMGQGRQSKRMCEENMRRDSGIDFMDKQGFLVFARQEPSHTTTREETAEKFRRTGYVSIHDQCIVVTVSSDRIAELAARHQSRKEWKYEKWHGIPQTDLPGYDLLAWLKKGVSIERTTIMKEGIMERKESLSVLHKALCHARQRPLLNATKANSSMFGIISAPGGQNNEPKYRLLCYPSVAARTRPKGTRRIGEVLPMDVRRLPNSTKNEYEESLQSKNYTEDEINWLIDKHNLLNSCASLPHETLESDVKPEWSLETRFKVYLHLRKTTNMGIRCLYELSLHQSVLITQMSKFHVPFQHGEKLTMDFDLRFFPSVPQVGSLSAHHWKRSDKQSHESQSFRTRIGTRGIQLSKAIRDLKLTFKALDKQTKDVIDGKVVHPSLSGEVVLADLYAKEAQLRKEQACQKVEVRLIRENLEWKETFDEDHQMRMAETVNINRKEVVRNKPREDVQYGLELVAKMKSVEREQKIQEDETRGLYPQEASELSAESGSSRRSEMQKFFERLEAMERNVVAGHIRMDYKQAPARQSTRRMQTPSGGMVHVMDGPCGLVVIRASKLTRSGRRGRTPGVSEIVVTASGETMEVVTDTDRPEHLASAMTYT